MGSPDIRPYVLSPHVAPLEVSGGVVRYRDGAERRRKVAICGAGGTKLMPWDDPSYECWALNNFWNAARDGRGRLAASRWWEMHQVTPDMTGLHAGQPIQDANDMRWIRTCPVPLYTTEPVPENPLAVVWPIADFAARYRDYFACTFAMQIAQAIHEGFETLMVCGLSLLRGTQREATLEAACVAYWLGLAEGKGMRLELRPEHDLLLWHPYQYGHDYWREADWVKNAYLARWDERPQAI